MARRLVTAEGKVFALRAYALPPLGVRDVRVQVSFAAPKHGTEGHTLGGSVFDRKHWDKTLRMFLPKAETEPPPAAPSERGIGNIVAGTVAEVGAEVTPVVTFEEAPEAFARLFTDPAAAIKSA